MRDLKEQNDKLWSIVESLKTKLIKLEHENYKIEWTL